MSSERKYSIVGGPNRDNLFDNMKFCCNEIVIPIKFDIVKGYSPSKDGSTALSFLLDVRHIKIHSLTHTDGTGYRFRIEGDIDVRYDAGEDYITQRFSANYQAKARTGDITITTSLI